MGAFCLSPHGQNLWSQIGIWRFAKAGESHEGRLAWGFNFRSGFGSIVDLITGSMTHISGLSTAMDADVLLFPLCEVWRWTLLFESWLKQNMDVSV